MPYDDGVMSDDAAPEPDRVDALLALYEQALPQVFGYLVRRCPTEALAEDLTADAFLAAVDACGRGTVTSPTVGWLIGVARNKLVDHPDFACPYISVHDGAAAIEFYKRAFGATERYRLTAPDGRLGHAEIEIGGSSLMLADEYPEYDRTGPRTLGGTPVTLTLAVPDVDAVVARAVELGAVLEIPVADMFYGSRSGTILDPFGHRWNIQTPEHEVSPEEMQRLMEE